MTLDDGDIALTMAATGLGGWTGYWAAALGHANAGTISDTTRWGGVLAGAGLSSIAASLMTPALTIDTDLVANAVALDALWSGAGAGAGALLSGRDDAPVWGLLGGGTAGARTRRGAPPRARAPRGGRAAPRVRRRTRRVARRLGPDARPRRRLRVGADARGGARARRLRRPGAHDAAVVRRSSGHRPHRERQPRSRRSGRARAPAPARSRARSRTRPCGACSARARPAWSSAARSTTTSRIGSAQSPLLGFAGAEGVWLGGWIPSLLHESGEAPDRERFGAVALGGFGAVGTATLLSSKLSIETDAIENAAALDALWTGAGAGAGALFSTQANAPVWGMLGAGTAGMVLGGALHREIALDAADAPLLTLAGTEGVWLGAWAPFVLRDSAHVTGRERMGALALGGFGGLGAATLASTGFELSPARGWFGGAGSAIGASIGGGLALMSPSLHGQGGVGLMLAGTTLASAERPRPRARLRGSAARSSRGAAAVGAALGASESLLFAWSGRASGDAQFGGAALTGAGVGSALGLAVALTPSGEKSAAPAAAGFAAWGAWSGAFMGSLVANDPHDDVMGGLIGANVGFLTGYALLRNDVVEAARLRLAQPLRRARHRRRRRRRGALLERQHDARARGPGRRTGRRHDHGRARLADAAQGDRARAGP